MVYNVEKIRAAITKLVEEKQCGPLLIRLAWHDAGTFCSKSKTGGARGCMRFEEEGESKFGANAGLGIARKLVQPIKDELAADMSFADFWALAAITAVKVMGGPDVTFRGGRADAQSVKESVEEGRHPDADKGADHLRSVFNRMGFNDQDIVVLSGAHTVGKCHPDRSGFEGHWTAAPNKFDNQYFVDLLGKTWIESTSSKGLPQFKDKETGELMMLISDMALIQDDKFRPLVEKYAADQDAFFNDFSSTFQKLLELGATDLSECA